MKFQIETGRLLLRELRMTDIEGMFELDFNHEVHKHLGNKPVKIKEKSQKIIKDIINNMKKEVLVVGRLLKNLLANLSAGLV